MSFLPITANDLPNGPSSASSGSQSPALPAIWAGIVPGIVLVAMITSVAYSARNLSGLTLFSPMILAVVAGMVYSNVLGMPAHAKAGIAFSQRRLLRFAIVLLGFQLTLGQVAGIGLGGVGIVAATLGATFFFTVTFGRLIGVDAKLAQLIAAGTSICGASAIVATNIVT
ncbi:putative sulfate exporter family transporter, partial [Mesorhizobium sp. M1E.F.Ca.ET.041.01.1.1]